MGTNINDERIMILKMLKEEKISIEEAEALLEVMETSDEYTGIGGEKERPRLEIPDMRGGRHRRRPGGEERGRKRRYEFHEHRGPGHGFDIDFDLDLGDIGSMLKETFAGVKETLRETFEGLGDLDIDVGVFDRFGKVKAKAVVEEQFDAQGLASLSLDNKWGDVSVVGEERDTIDVTARVAAWGADSEEAQDIADSVTVHLDRDGDTAALGHNGTGEGPKRRVRVNYQLRVPQGIALRLNTLSGDIEVAGTLGDVTASSLSGDMSLTATGPVDVNTASGDVNISGASGKVAAKTASGDLSITVDEYDGVMAKTASGDVSVDIPTDVGAQVMVKTVSGDISCSLPLESENGGGKRTLSGTLNGGGPELTIVTASGDIDLGRD